WIEWYDSLAKPSWTPAPATISLTGSILYPVIVASFGFVFVQAFRGKVGWKVAIPFAITGQARSQGEGHRQAVRHADHDVPDGFRGGEELLDVRRLRHGNLVPCGGALPIPYRVIV